MTLTTTVPATASMFGTASAVSAESSVRTIDSPPAPPASASSPASSAGPVPSVLSAPPAAPPETSTRFDPATLPDLPFPDRDTPGPGPTSACSANPAYNDEPTDGLAQNVVVAYGAAKAAAAAQGVALCLNDGKRSTAQQQQTYDDYVEQYGEAVANTYVLPPEKSAHVAGYAIDVQPASGYGWLEATAGEFGLCRIYDIEPWHFEFDRGYGAGCPARIPAPIR